MKHRDQNIQENKIRSHVVILSIDIVQNYLVKEELLSFKIEKL